MPIWELSRQDPENSGLLDSWMQLTGMLCFIAQRALLLTLYLQLAQAC